MEKITLTSNNNKTWWSKEDIAELYIKPHMDELDVKITNMLTDKIDDITLTLKYINIYLDGISERLSKLEDK